MNASISAVLASTLSASLLLNPALTLAQNAAAVTPRRITPPSSEAATRSLPVRRVALYKNGVGFFEHAGQVNGNQQVTIDFTTAQLNDVLQTLTAIDLNGGKIGGAGYNSTTPLEQQLRNLPLALGEGATEADFYQAIRGARVEVTGSGAAITGRLLNVESRNVNTDTEKPTVTRQFLTVISDSGAVRTVELGSNTQVRLLEGSLNQDVSRYLQLLSSTRNQGLRHLTLDATGTGARELRVSYISEVPIWKSTYRLLFSDDAQKQSATLQAWAVVDNTVGADWDNVQLSLIAGAPQSFIQPISQPYYSRRPEIGLPHEAQLSPQTHESGEMLSIGSGSAAGMGGGAAGGVMGGIGVAPAPPGVTNETVEVTAASPMVAQKSIAINGRQFDPNIRYAQLSQGAMARAAMDSFTANTSTNAYDDFFEYKLTQPITIRKNESAMVPILQSKIDAERVTLWSPSQARPLRALWITNTTNATLDRGSFSIIENGNFGGEGLLDPIHPKEKRLLSYAADDAVRVSSESNLNSRHLQKIVVHQGVLTSSNREVAEVTYVVHNAAAEPRTIVVEHNRRQGWELDSDPKPAETTPIIYRYQVKAAAGEIVRLHVGESHTLSQTWRLANMNEDQLNIIVRTNGDDPKLRAQLQPLIDSRQKVAGIDSQIRMKQQRIDEISNDQTRLRNNLSALKGSAEEKALVKRYTTELNTQEDQIAELRKEQETLRTQRTQAQSDLDAKINALEVEQVF